MNPVINWCPREVSAWLEKKGHSKYSRLLTEDHCIDGRALLLINEADLKSPPISINVSLLCLNIFKVFIISTKHHLIILIILFI